MFPPGAESSGQASGGENPQPDLQPHPTMGHHYHPTMGHHLHPPDRAPHASEDSDGNMSEEGKSEKYFQLQEQLETKKVKNGSLRMQEQ